MMFFLKKLLGSMLMPLPFCLMICFFGLFLSWRGKSQKPGKVLVGVGLILLAFLSSSPVSKIITAPLDCKFEAYGGPGAASAVKERGNVKYVVVLAGGHSSHPSLPVTARLYCQALMRMMEGVRVFRQNPGSKLILSGGGVYCDPVPEALVMADVAKFLGVNGEDIILESGSKDTKDQARLIKPMVGDNPFVLVTSAAHMPRSMALFRKMGMDPIPAPAGQNARARQTLTPGSVLPNSRDLNTTSSAMHEYLGLLWAGLRGQI